MPKVTIRDAYSRSASTGNMILTSSAGANGRPAVPRCAPLSLFVVTDDSNQRQQQADRQSEHTLPAEYSADFHPGGKTIRTATMTSLATVSVSAHIPSPTR
jgi:hypothetical protein